jgi:acetyl esterase
MKFTTIRSVVAIFTFFLLSISTMTYSQTCSTGKVDERVSAFLKNVGPEPTLAQLKTTPIAQLKKGGPPTFKALPSDSVKRIKITKDNIGVNVVKASMKDGLPVIINYHGGGFISPLLPWMEYDAMTLAKKFNAVVFDVDYRVAPEFKFPTASNDAFNAYKWVLEHAKEYGGDASKIVIHGTSAGANLAALVTQRAKKENLLKPIKLMILNCPPTDNPNTSYYASYEENAKGYMLTKDNALFLVEQYLDKTEWYKNNPEMWPIHAQDLSGLPSSLIITAEFDILRDEGIAYAKKLEKAGNQVQIMCFPHQIHTLVGLPGDAKEIKELHAIMGEAMSKAIAKP